MTYIKPKPSAKQLEDCADKIGNALAVLAFLDHGILPEQIETVKEVHEELLQLMDDCTPQE